jgi:hypothetical protein
MSSFDSHKHQIRGSHAQEHGEARVGHHQAMFIPECRPQGLPAGCCLYSVDSHQSVNHRAAHVDLRD